MNKGRLIVISAPSGTGKGSICQGLFEIMDNMEFSISMTTRKPRKGEIHGINYYFVTEEEFKDTIKEDGFLEYARVFDNFYGTPKKQVLKQLSNGKNVILEIDVQGALEVKKTEIEAVFIFIMPPSLETLKDRLLTRGSETEESLKIRLSEAEKEIKMAKHYDYVVVNDELEKAISEVHEIIKNN